MSWATNLRLNVAISDIDRPSDPNVPITITFKVPEQSLNELKWVEQQMQFDYLILACPLTDDVFVQLGLKQSSDEEFITKRNRISEYCMTTFWVDNMDMPQPIGPVLPLPMDGTPWAVARQFQDLGNRFTQFYTQSTGQQSDDDVIAKVKDLIGILGGKINETQERWHSFDRFTYFQHVTSDEIASGFYKKLAAMQGSDRTYYVGGLTDFELIEPIVEHSKHLVKTHFAG